MKRLSLAFALVAAIAAVGAFCAPAAQAGPIVYGFVALPGPVATCQWFADNLNDRSLGAMIRQTDLLYNRVALPPDVPVTVTQTATTAKGNQVVQFNLASKTVCASADAVTPPTPVPSP